MKKFLLCSLMFFWVSLSCDAQISFFNTFGAANDWEESTSRMIQHSDGDLVVCGHRGGFISGHQAWICKADTAGVPKWFAVLDSSGGGVSDFLGGMVETTDGGIVLCGSSGKGPLMMKVDAAGNLLWKRGFRPKGTVNAQMHSVYEMTDGSLVALGQANRNLVIAKTNSAGAYVFMKHITLAGDVQTAVATPSPGGGWLMAGRYSPSGGTAAFAVLLDSLGDVTWSRHFNSLYEINCATPMASGWMIVGSDISPTTMNNEVVVIRLSQAGNVEWSRKHGAAGRWENIYAILPDGSDKFLLLGDRYSGATPPYPGVVLGIDSLGDTLFVRQALATMRYTTGTLATDGMFHLSGHAFPPVTTTYLYDSFLSRILRTGQGCQLISSPDWIASPASVSTSLLTTTVSASTDSMLYVGSYASATYDFSVICSALVTGTEGPRAEAQLELFPNPAQGKTTLRSQAHIEPSQIFLCDPQGRSWIPQVNQLSLTDWEIDLAGLPPGIYTVAIPQQGQRQCRKLAVY